MNIIHYNYLIITSVSAINILRHFGRTSLKMEPCVSMVIKLELVN